MEMAHFLKRLIWFRMSKVTICVIFWHNTNMLDTRKIKKEIKFNIYFIKFLSKMKNLLNYHYSGYSILNGTVFILSIAISVLLFRNLKILFFWQDNSATLLTSHLRAYTIIYFAPLMARFFFKAQAIIVTVTSQGFRLFVLPVSFVLS